MLHFNDQTVFLNDMERDSYMKTLTDMCEVLAKDIANRDNRTVEDVLADAYLNSGRDIWHETFNVVLKTFTSESDGTNDN